MAAREQRPTQSEERPAVESIFPPRAGGGLPAKAEQTGGAGGGDGSAWLEFAREQFAQAGERKESFDRRAIAIVTGSATVVSLLVAGASLSVKDHSFHIPGNAKYTLTIAGLLFFAAALFAIGAAYPWKYEEFDAKAIREIADGWWDEESQSNVERVLTVSLMDKWAELQKVNDRKGRSLLFAIIAQMLGVLGVAVGAAMIVF